MTSSHVEVHFVISLTSNDDEMRFRLLRAIEFGCSRRGETGGKHHQGKRGFTDCSAQLNRPFAISAIPKAFVPHILQVLASHRPRQRTVNQWRTI